MIEVGVEPQTQAIAPGERGAYTVTVRNRGNTAARVAVSASREVADWAWANPTELDVAPGGSATARLSLRLPPPPNPPAGRVAFTVDAGGAIAMAAVDVLAVVDVSASLGPPEGEKWGYPLTVRNKGNAPAVVALEGDGDGVTVDPPSVTVEAGGQATASVHVRGRDGAPFRVSIRPETGAASVVTGVAEQAAAGGVRRLLKWPVAVPVLAVVLVAGVLSTRGGNAPEPAADSDIGGVTVPDDPSCPARNHLAADPAGLPPRQVPIPSRYAFLEVRTGGCEPVRFNPCEPVRYVVNTRLAPAGALADLEAAFALLAEATGMTFVNEGPTDETTGAARPLIQPQRYPGRWAPILITWEHGERFGMEDTNPAGGRPFSVGGVFVSGYLIVNVDAKDVRIGFGDGATWGRVFLHELGHLVGLGHTRASTDVMFHELALQRGRAQYQAGDLEGLKHMGREAGCLTTPRPAGA